MILSDADILKRPGLLSPFDRKRVQPASVDLTLDRRFLVPDIYDPSLVAIDLRDVKGTYDLDPLVEVETDSLVLDPQMFCLGSTYEHVAIPDDLVARVEGRSSLGRLGLLVHATAGYIDPGYEGKITLEFYNLGRRPILLRPGVAICQVSFIRLSSKADRPYGTPGLGSKYQNSESVVASRYGESCVTS